MIYAFFNTFVILCIHRHSCDGKTNCDTLVGNTVFHDPCNGTYKYLNVSYKCLAPPPSSPPPAPSSEFDA